MVILYHPQITRSHPRVRPPPMVSATQPRPIFQTTSISPISAPPKIRTTMRTINYSIRSMLRECTGVIIKNYWKTVQITLLHLSQRIFKVTMISCMSANSKLTLFFMYCNLEWFIVIRWNKFLLFFIIKKSLFNKFCKLLHYSLHETIQCKISWIPSMAQLLHGFQLIDIFKPYVIKWNCLV